MWLRNYCAVDGRIWLLVIVLGGLVVRGSILGEPMRYDESFTFLNFIQNEFSRLFFYLLPNNHVFHSVLVKISTVMWGVEPAIIRLPAFVSGVLIIPFAYVLARALGGSGIIAAALCAVSPLLVFYSVNARGYTLVALFTLLMALVGRRYLNSPSFLKCALLSLIAALGLFTIPTMIFPVAAIVAWVFIVGVISGIQPGVLLVRFLVPFGLLAMLLSASFYTPVYMETGKLDPIVINRFVPSLPWNQFVTSLVPNIQHSWQVISRDIPVFVLAGVALLTLWGLYEAGMNRNWPILLLLPCLLATSAVLLVWNMQFPLPRTWTFAIPLIAVVADYGYSQFERKVYPALKVFVRILVLGVCSLVAIPLVIDNRVAGYPDTGRFVEAELVANYLKPVFTANDRFHANPPADWPVRYYFWYYNLPLYELDENTETRKYYIAIKNSTQKVTDATDLPVEPVLRHGDLTLYRVKTANP